jgi:D-alanine-D-alanine ligase
MAPSKVTVLYNTDYDDELTGPELADSSVEASARAIGAALEASGYRIEMVGVHGHDVLEVIGKLRASKPELVFNLCESMAGDSRNEPTFAGLLDLFKIPYTGADLVALTLCLHKRRSKDVMLGRGIKTPPYRYLADPRSLDDATLEELDYPWFLKLAHEDASVGITEENVVHDAAALRRRALALFEEFGLPLLAERFIDGREVNVTLIGNGAELQVLPLHEIDFSAMPPDRPHIVSYAAKWEENHVDYAGTRPVPVRDSDPTFAARCEAVARAAWDAHGLRDYARVDLRIDATGTPYVIDVNPNPDISPGAGVARAAEAAGMSFEQMIAKIIEVAWRREQSEA